MPVLVAAFILSVPFVWLTLFFLFNDFSVPSARPGSYRRLLAVFPHPDDEVLTIGGLIGEFRTLGAETTLFVLTAGERGTSDASLNEGLKEIREAELKKSGRVLGALKVIQKDFGDGKLAENYERMLDCIRTVVGEERPDLIITFDRSGLYGHEDHIACSRAVREAIKNSDFALWYASTSPKTLKFFNLPTHMAKNDEYINDRTRPSHKVFIGLNVVRKIRALYAHKSQFESFRKGLPFKRIPAWFLVSAFVFEYFCEAPPQSL